MNKNLLTTVSTALATAALVLFVTDDEPSVPTSPQPAAAPSAAQAQRNAATPQGFQRAMQEAMQSLSAQDQQHFDDLFASFGANGGDDFTAEDFATLFEGGSFEALGYGGGNFDAAAMEQALGEWQGLVQQFQSAMQGNALNGLGYGGGDSYYGWANPPSKQSFYANEGQNGFYANNNLGTAVSTSGDSGYISLGNGQFVSW